MWKKIKSEFPIFGWFLEYLNWNRRSCITYLRKNPSCHAKRHQVIYKNNKLVPDFYKQKFDAVWCNQFLKCSSAMYVISEMTSFIYKKAILLLALIQSETYYYPLLVECKCSPFSCQKQPIGVLIFYPLYRRIIKGVKGTHYIFYILYSFFFFFGKELVCVLLKINNQHVWSIPASRLI